MCKIVSVVNKVLHTLKFVKMVNLMLIVLNRHTHRAKGHKDTLGGVACVYVHTLIVGMVITAVCICLNSSKCTHLICVVLFILIKP